VIVRPTDEAPLREVFDQLREGIFVDVGAHVGKYTIMMGRRLGRKGRVIAIEPEPSNFAALTTNVRLNRLTNVSCFAVACTDSEGPVPLYLARHASMHSLERGSGEAITVNGRALDGVLESLGIDSVALMKIDVEGAEGWVLRGAERTLRRSRDVTVLLEAWSVGPLRYLKSLGFTVSSAAGAAPGQPHLGYYIARRTSRQTVGSDVST